MIIFMALLIWLSPIGGARTYIVDDSGFANYNTIQEAVVAAGNGDTIYIKPGVYSEEVVLNKSLKLMPLTGESDPIIFKGDGKETGITITSNGCFLEGLTLQNFAGPAIHVKSSQNTIQKNVFKDANPAILVRGSHENLIAGNTIMDSRGAVALWGNSSENQVSENEIVGCNVSIFIREAEGNEVLSNEISDAFWGIWLIDAESCRIDGNDIESKSYGIWLLNSSAVSVLQNKVRITNSASSITNGISLANASEIELQGNQINGGAIGLLITNSTNNKMKDNGIKASEFGIRMENSEKNSFTQNRIEDSSIGFGLGLSQQNNITENQLSGITDTAVQISYSRENFFSENQISDSSKGIILFESSANRLQANRFQNVEWCLYVEAGTKEGFDNSIDESNVVDFVPIVYLFGQSSGQIEDREIAHLTLAYCENVTVKNTAITNDAIFLFDSKNNRIMENNISNCFGMRLLQSDENEISGNSMLGNRYSGMFLYGSDLNQIAGNSASENSQNGISLLSCNKNAIRDNMLDGNMATGIWLNLSNDNQIYQNNVSNNSRGLQVMLSAGNKIFHNNFVRNQDQSQDLGGNNSWDDGNTTGGNYWSDHVAKGNPSQEWPRIIKGGNMMDRFPFQDETGWSKAQST
jgi:parallel beta-helix repeat protein